MDDRDMSKEELSWELTALKVRLEKLEFIKAERGASERRAFSRGGGVFG